MAAECVEVGKCEIAAKDRAKIDLLTKVEDVGMTISSFSGSESLSREPSASPGSPQPCEAPSATQLCEALASPQPCAAPSAVASRRVLMAERDELRAAEAAWQAVSKQARKKKTRR